MINKARKYYICITPFFPTKSSWRGSYVYDQVKAIQRNSNFELIVFLPCSIWASSNQYIVHGIKVYTLPSVFMPSYFFNGLTGGFNGISLLIELNKRNISLKDIAVLHCHTGAFASYASALKKKDSEIKTILQYHDLDPYQLRLGKFALWKPNLNYRFKNLVKHFKNIDVHLCISKKTEFNLLNFPNPHPHEQYTPYLKMLKHASHLLPPNNIKTYVLYNGVDMSVFNTHDSSSKSDTFIIGCIANFNELKGHMTLIKAIERLIENAPNLKIKIIFIGSGETKSMCMDYILEHNMVDYFEFRTEIKHEELVNFYNTLDLFVLPSYFEGLGCVYLEAAACKVPFMGCLYQGYSEYIADIEQKHWLIEPLDDKSLSCIIKEYIDNPIPQNLRYPIDIDTLIIEYLNSLESS